jgi:hypothetical protein
VQRVQAVLEQLARLQRVLVRADQVPCIVAQPDAGAAALEALLELADLAPLLVLGAVGVDGDGDAVLFGQLLEA